MKKIMKENIKKNIEVSLIRHFEELLQKIENEFDNNNFNLELHNLKVDPVYSLWHFDRKEYVLIRKMGRISISIGRRLGDVYDKVIREAIMARFDLTLDQVAPKLGDKPSIEIDAKIGFNDINKNEIRRIKKVARSTFLKIPRQYEGLGIECRYNFNPNDSARLRKDLRMYELVANSNLIPIFLVFSTSSPRQDAINRLSKTGWKFLIGNDSYKFLKNIVEFDFKTFLKSKQIQSIMKDNSNKIFTLLKKKYKHVNNKIL